MGNQHSREQSKGDEEAGWRSETVRERSSRYSDPEQPHIPSRTSAASRHYRQLPFEDRLFDGALSDGRISMLFENGSRRDGQRRRIEPLVRLRVLQYMNIIHMKKLLAREVSIMSERRSVTNNQMARVRGLMKDYVGALRDLQYMLEPTSRFSRTASFLRKQFYINMQHDSAILECEGLVHPDYKFPDGGYGVRVPEYAGYGGFSHTRDTEGQLSQEFWGRLRVAILTGLSLIAPMLFMKLYDNLIAQLTTASVAVLILGAILSYVEEMQKKDVVAATAAYAAVLVVFIGTSS